MTKDTYKDDMKFELSKVHSQKRLMWSVIIF